MKSQVDVKNMLLDNDYNFYPCYKIANKLVELCLCASILQKVELSSNELGCLAEEIFKQSVQGGSLVSPDHL